MASNSNDPTHKGRRPTKMEKIENKKNLTVSFCKRRQGAFKKAHELTVLTGAEVAVITFTPTGKVYSYGHPSVETVVGRFLTGVSPPLTQSELLFRRRCSEKVVEIMAKTEKTRMALAIEKNRQKALDRMLANCQSQHLGVTFGEQSLQQMQQFLAALEKEINTKDPLQLQNAGYNYNAGEGGLLPLPGPVPFPIGPNAYEVCHRGGVGPSGFGGIWSSGYAVGGDIGHNGFGGIGPNGYAFGGSTNAWPSAYAISGSIEYSGYALGGSTVAPNSFGLGFYNSSAGCTSTTEPSSFNYSGGGPVIARPSSLVGTSGGGGGRSNLEFYTMLGSASGSSWQLGTGPLRIGSNSFMGGGEGGGGSLPCTDVASSFGARNDGGDTNATIYERDGSMP